MNILLLSVGTRNKIVQYFKAALRGTGRVVTADCQSVAPALYEGDRHYIVPRITEPGYIDTVLGICERESVDGVLSLIDPELSLLARHKESLKRRGVTLIGSDYEPCELAFNKFRMYQWLSERGYRCARTFPDFDAFAREYGAGRISLPAFLKPVCGSASQMITRIEDLDMARFLMERSGELILQEFLDGQEIGADVYVDLISHEPVSIFLKKKLKMRAGETDKSVSFRDEACFSLIRRFVKEGGWTGPVDIDLFEIDGEYVISEVNPRFGGGYPHAYECGCDHMKMIINNLLGRANEDVVGQYPENVYMMKYSEIMIKTL